MPLLSSSLIMPTAKCVLPTPILPITSRPVASLGLYSFINWVAFRFELNLHPVVEFAQVENPVRLCTCCGDVCGIVQRRGKTVFTPFPHFDRRREPRNELPANAETSLTASLTTARNARASARRARCRG